MRTRSLALAGLMTLAVGCARVGESTVRQTFVPLMVREHPNGKGVGSTYNQCEDVGRVGASWYYTWGREPATCGGVEAVPMLWGAGDVGQPIGGNSAWLMGFNEPDLASQANTTPEDGAVLWHEIEQMYPNKRLVSPAVLSAGWLDAWWSAYVGLYGGPPRVDAVAAHGYADSFVPQTAASLCEFKIGAIVDWARARGIGEVWITEFAFVLCLPSGVAGSIVFMDEMIAYFESEPMITRYAWFQLSYRDIEPWGWGPDCNTSLIDFETGELTALGEAYRGQ